MDGAVDFVFTVKEVMSKCARRLSGQGSLNMMEAFQNICWFLPIDS